MTRFSARTKRLLCDAVIGCTARVYGPRGLRGQERSYRKFVIAGYQRSGSTMLVSALDGHPAIKCFSEIFNFEYPMFMTDGYPEGGRWLTLIRNHFPAQFLNAFVFRGYPAAIMQVGFKVFPPQATNPRFAATVKDLFGDPAVAIIHLRRRNKLAMYLSFLRASQTNEWGFDGSTRPVVPPVRIEVGACRAAFEQLARAEDAFARLIAGREHFALDYEDIVSAPDDVYRRLLVFLGVPWCRLTTRTHKQRSLPLRTSITNFDELADAFAATPWASCFEHDDA